MEDFLYDLEADPRELRSLTANPGYPEVREQLAERLKARMIAVGEKSPTIKPVS